MGVLEEKMRDYWERTPQAQRPSWQSVKEAIKYWVEGVKKDESQQFSACWQLAQYLDYLKRGWGTAVLAPTTSGSTNASQVPWALLEMERVGEKVRQTEFAQRTPRFQT